MLFSSLEFIFLFLPIALGVYYIAPRSCKNLVIFISGILFYAFGEIRLTPIFLLTVIFNFFLGRIIERFAQRRALARFFLALAIVFNLSLLGFFKYFDFFRASVLGLDVLGIALPIGISFYTFQALSYVTDVFWGRVSASRSLVSFGAYIAFFPQLIAGPIVKYSDIERQLRERSVSCALFASGLRSFIAGLAKKLILANSAGALFESLLESESYITAVFCIFFFGMQIYFDFSGYSDMAIGLARLFGFELTKNFDYPYTSRSISEFWRRWHISLSHFFKEYLYIPLGGSRRGRARTALNLAIVWTLTGLWHGASWSFLLWGAYFALLLILEKLALKNILSRLPSPILRLYSIFFIFLGWLIFASDGITLSASCGASVFARLFLGKATCFAEKYELYLLVGALPFALILIIGSTSIPRRIYCKIIKKAPALTVILPLAAFVACIAYSVSSGYNPFLYFRF